MPIATDNSFNRICWLKSRLIAVSKGKLVIVKRIPVVPSNKPIVDGIPPVVTSEYFNLRHLLFPKRFLDSQKYFAIEVLPSSLIDSEEVHAVAGESLVVAGFLMSSVFPIWVRGITGKSEGRIDYKNSYNTFPFPDFSKNQEEELLSRVSAVLRARGTSSGRQLADIYCLGDIPDHLVMAHEDLDEVVLSIFGLPVDADNDQILEKLFEDYLLIFQD